MGYSYNAIAGFILEAIDKLPQFNDPTRSLFYEIGRENEDGAITGSVFKVWKDGTQPGETLKCIRFGSFRISKDGIERFPGLTKEEKIACEVAGFAQYDLEINQHRQYRVSAV